MLETPQIPPGVDPEKPAPARLYDYYLGGTTNFPVDREAAERIRADLPEISDMAWANRGFHQRAARWLAAEYLRPRAEVERFFEGLELVPPFDNGEPRLVFMGEWGAEDPELADSDGSRWGYCGVARV